jgi:hypothetical protein
MEWMDDKDVGLKRRFHVNVLFSGYLVSHVSVMTLIYY